MGRLRPFLSRPGAALCGRYRAHNVGCRQGKSGSEWVLSCRRPLAYTTPNDRRADYRSKTAMTTYPPTPPTGFALPLM